MMQSALGPFAPPKRTRRRVLATVAVCSLLLLAESFGRDVLWLADPTKSSR